MECLTRGFAQSVHPSGYRTSGRKENGKIIKAALNFHANEDDDPLFQAAVSRAFLRHQETHRPDPLFVDSYSGCLIPPNLQMAPNTEQQLHSYCLRTRFIDDKLLSLTKNIGGVKQVVLFTDGMDTRAYRLPWPSSTIIFDVSPERVHKSATQKLEGMGARIPRSCLLRHVPIESSNIQQTLLCKGFDSKRPSIWAFQGSPVLNLACFKDVLFLIGSLAIKGSLLVGELPYRLTETKFGTKSPKNKWMDELFMTYGFRVDLMEYNEVAKDLCEESMLEDDKNLLYVAEHLRFSDDQMETWRREFQRIEDEGDEEGFEEL